MSSLKSRKVGVVSSSVVLFTLEKADGLDGHVMNSLGLMQRTIHAKKGADFPRVKRGLILWIFFLPSPTSQSISVHN